MQFAYSDIPRLEGPAQEALWPDFASPEAEELKSAGRIAVAKHLDIMKAGLTPAVIIDKRLVDYVLGVSFLANVERLSLGMYQSEPDVEWPEAADCFRAVNELVGPVEHGRDLNHFSRQMMIPKCPSSLDDVEGFTHLDGFNGFTVHVQRRVIRNRARKLVIGLRRSDPGAPRTPFASVEEGITEPTIWRGHVRTGDVTILNSGLQVPEGDFLASVHQFLTDYASPRKGQATCSFSQFMEN